MRERVEEIPTLALHFMERAGRKLGLEFAGISEADMECLTTYRWPGNVCELEHLIERAALLSEPPRLRIPPLQDAFAAGDLEHPAARDWVTLRKRSGDTCARSSVTPAAGSPGRAARPRSSI